MKSPPEQEAIRDRCFHPSGNFVEFRKEDIGQSIPHRFEKILRMYPDHLAARLAGVIVRSERIVAPYPSGQGRYNEQTDKNDQSERAAQVRLEVA